MTQLTTKLAHLRPLLTHHLPKRIAHTTHATHAASKTASTESTLHTSESTLHTSKHTAAAVRRLSHGLLLHHATAETAELIAHTATNHGALRLRLHHAATKTAELLLLWHLTETTEHLLRHLLLWHELGAGWGCKHRTGL